MKIAVDLDGVLADASKIWMRLLNEKFDILVENGVASAGVPIL